MSDNYGKALQDLKKKLGLNSSELCVRYKLSRSAFFNWENNIKTPSNASKLLLECILKQPDLMAKIINDEIEDE